jgi:hypothetical protein
MLQKEREILLEISQLLKAETGIDAAKEIDFDLSRINSVSEELDSFFVSYSERYGVDMSEFNYYDYFYEDVLLFSGIVRFVSKSILKKEKKPLTLRTLIQYAINRKWG